MRPGSGSPLECESNPARGGLLTTWRVANPCKGAAALPRGDF